MSKKKNTLKDLDEFLKQQAATLAPPSKLSEQIEETPKPVKTVQPSTSNKVSVDKILEDIGLLMEQEGPSFRKKLYDIIIRSTESLDKSLPEDKMLINTALYLKSGDQWKDAIREYWRTKGQA